MYPDHLVSRAPAGPATTRCCGTTAGCRRTRWSSSPTTSATSTPGTVLCCAVLYCTVLLSRCTRSVSYPAPTYYSHLAADRARKHHDHLTEKERKSQEAAKKILEEEGSKANLMYFV